MFTGLIEATGTLVTIEPRGEQSRFWLDLPFRGELVLGESVAVNGCCLTVAEFGEKLVAFDLLKQTLTVTALGDLTEGSVVNLERAMKAGDRFGGHFVLGHVDATGRVLALEKVGQDHRFQVSLPAAIARLCIDKGSLAIDGISLTIAELTGDSATFWITPHTFAHTHLIAAKAGQSVNLEADMLAKHVAKMLGK